MFYPLVAYFLVIFLHKRMINNFYISNYFKVSPSPFHSPTDYEVKTIPDLRSYRNHNGYKYIYGF